MKEFMRKAIGLLAIILFVFFDMQSFAADNNKLAPIDLQIDHVCWNVSNPQAGNDGAVYINMRNRSEKTVVVPLGGIILGKGGKTILREYGYAEPTKLVVDGEPWTSVGAGFSLCKYEWLDENGKATLHGTYDISRQNVVLSKDASDAIVVPVKIPPSIGKYRLRISIDNRAIRMALKSYNSFDHATNYFFGEMKIDAAVRKF